MNTPMISVVMPVFNGEKYLNQAIDSILGQSFQDFEFIILNDGSTDKTENIILSYSDPRIVYVKNEQNLHIVKTLNKGIYLARWKYIARMDADDISLPERLKNQFQFMEINKNIGVCGTWLKTFGSRVNYWRYPNLDSSIKATLIFHSSLAHPSVMMRKSILGFNCYVEDFAGAEDYALWLALFKKTEFHNIPKVLFKYRLHKNQTDKQAQLNSANELRKIMLRNINCTLEGNDLIIFQKISSNEKVDINDAERILIQIRRSNTISGVVEKEALAKILNQKYLQVLNNQAQCNLSLYFKYRRSLLSKNSRCPLLMHFKFFIKCILRYSNEK